MPTVIWFVVIDLIVSAAWALYRADQGGTFRTPTDHIVSAIEAIALVVWMLVVFL